MKSNRLFAVTAAFSLCFSMVTAQTDFIGMAKIPAHPRILMLKGEEAAIKKTIAADETWGKLQAAILAESDNLLPQPAVERIKIGRRLLD